MHKEILKKLRKAFKWIRGHKYISVTLVFLAIIFVIDDNNMIIHFKNKSKINALTGEIKSMEADSAVLQKKLKLYTDRDKDVIADIARERGLLKKDEEMYIIKE